MGAKRLLSAEKSEHKTAVEIKSFLGKSGVTALHGAVGQYTLYHDVLDETDSFGQLMLANKRIQLLIFDPEKEEIVKWIP